MENQKFTILRDGYYLCGLESFGYGTRFHGHFVADPSRSVPLTFLQASSLCDELQRLDPEQVFEDPCNPGKLVRIGKFEVLPFLAPDQEVQHEN